ncbi:hypothetical protein K435DRAFT_780208, partial [Dendrothele bispora CBS 962.96]
MNAQVISKSHWSSTWRNTPLTPPMSTAFERRKMPDPQPLPPSTTTLPSIAFLDRHLSDRSIGLVSALPPLTPPDDAPPPHYSPTPEMDVDPKHQLFVDTHLTAVDWIDFSRTRSAHFIAEKTCEMICYLWFSAPPQSSSHPQSPASSYSPPSSSSPLFNRPTPPSTLQFVATPNFVSFMQKLLETTQVSQSVIVLSLHYIYRLKERNRFTHAQAGSEFRIAVAGLMMANKFLDDNTYTNKTWSEVSGISLEEINRMEREFLMGVDCNLYVDKATYQSWLHLLKGLVMNKERDSRHFLRKTRLAARGTRHHPHIPTTPSKYSSRGRTQVRYRARSTSPDSSRRLPYPQVTIPPPYSFSTAVAAASSYPTPHSTLSQTLPTQPPQYSDRPADSSSFVVVPSHTHTHTTPYNSLPPSPSPIKPGAGSKRTAAAAFSPTSAAFAHIPSKRPVGISLQIPETSVHGISSALANAGSSGSSASASGPSSYSPLEGLGSFARMSIDERGVSAQQQQQQQQQQTSQQQVSVPPPPPPSSAQVHHEQSSTSLTWSKKPMVPETLVAGYAVDPERRSNVPKNLYFYTLACSPLELATASYGSSSSSNTPVSASTETMESEAQSVHETDIDDARAQEESDADSERYDRIRKGAKKARLRYHHPGEYNPYSYGSHTAAVPSYSAYSGSNVTTGYAAPVHSHAHPTTTTTTTTSSSNYPQSHQSHGHAYSSTPSSTVPSSTVLPPPPSALPPASTMISTVSSTTTTPSSYVYPALRNAMGSTPSYSHHCGPTYPLAGPAIGGS